MGLAPDAVTHALLSGLAADIFGTPIIDDAANTVRNTNQAKLSAGPGLDPGEYLVDTITFTLLSGSVTITPGLFGEVLGLGEGSCPGTVEGCTVSFAGATATVMAVPEPRALLLIALSGAAIAVLRRRLTAPALSQPR